MSKVKITVNDQTVECNSTDTYYEAITRQGVEIPALCHEPELKPSGACRICVVEVEGAPNLVPSCCTTIQPNAIVKTDSEKVKKARQILVELILESHPLNCIICEKAGECVLQKLAYDYVPVARLERFVGIKPKTHLLETNEFFSLNYNACIRCGKCVRVVDEIQLCGVLSMEQRGFETYPSTGFGRSFEEAGCIACGNCVAVCPVSALVPQSILGQGRNWEFERTVSICSYCGVGCQFEIVTNKNENKIVYVDSHKNAEVNGLSLCVKGRYGWEYVHHKDRLTKPLIRKKGKLVETTWEEALKVVEEKLRKVHDEYGSDALGFLSSAKCTNEENYLFQKLARAVFGTNNVDHCARLCHASTVTGLAKSFGSGAMTNSIVDLTNDAEVIFIIGSNTTEAHPVIGVKIKQAIKEGKTKIIVADPREIELSKEAEIYLQQRPGTDVALINALMKVIIDEKLYDKEFIENRTENFEEMQKMLENYSLDVLCKIAGVEQQKVQQAAILYASAKTAAIVYSMGITQHTNGTNNVMSLANLAMMTGNIGKAGTGVNPLRGQNNVQGACDVGALPNVYPSYQKVDDISNKEKFQRTWKVPFLSDKVGLTITELIDGADKGSVKSLYILGENVVLSEPNISHVRESLEKLDFLVVQDILLTETAKMADIVLPGVTFAEKDGTFTNTERRVQRIRKALQPIGEAMPDWQILQQLLKNFGLETNYSHPSEIFDELASVTPIYTGINYDRIENIGLQWPCPSEEHKGTAILHEKEFSRGKGKFHAISFLEPAELPSDEYPYILTTGRNLFHFHTGEMTRRVKGLDQRKPRETSEINADDAKILNIKDGDEILIESRRGKVTSIAKVTDRIKPGVVFMTFHFKESAANLLTNDAVDPQAKIPELKVCAIKIKKN